MYGLTLECEHKRTRRSRVRDTLRARDRPAKPDSLRSDRFPLYFKVSLLEGYMRSWFTNHWMAHVKHE